jgi:mRNA interferase MazF
MSPPPVAAASPHDPRRGEVWYADLDPALGHEQGKRRPVLVVSHNRFNEANNELCIVLALTRRHRGMHLHVPVRPPEGGLPSPSVVQCEQIRTISYARLIRRLGSVSAETMQAVEVRLRQVVAL